MGQRLNMPVTHGATLAGNQQSCGLETGLDGYRTATPSHAAFTILQQPHHGSAKIKLESYEFHRRHRVLGVCKALCSRHATISLVRSQRRHCSLRSMLNIG